MAYQAIIARIKVRDHPNADRLKLGTILGTQVVIGLDTQDNELGVFFPCDGTLSEEHCKFNDLLPRFDEQGKRVGGGYFDPKRRVRAQKFRGEKSEGFYQPISSLAWTKYDLSKLKEGDAFEELNGKKVCEKWVNPATLQARSSNQPKTRKANPLFLEHVDTKQFRYELDNIPDGSLLYISEKLHGTCLFANTPILLASGESKTIKEIVNSKYEGDVLGIDSFGNITPTKILSYFNNGKTYDWMKISFNCTRNNKKTLNYNVICTLDHLFWVENREKYVEAQDLLPDDIVLQIHKDYLLTETQKQVLIGKMLGDGHFPATHDVISFSHKKEHEEYIDFQLNLLGDIAYKEKKEYKSGYGTKMIRARTHASVGLAAYFEGWNNGVNRKKIIPESAIEQVKSLALAIWYMDDGSLSHNKDQQDRANFAICRYDKESAENAVKILEKFGLSPVLFISQGKYYRIRLNYEDANRFFTIIKPYVPPIMQYKLPMQFRGGSNQLCYKSPTLWGWVTTEQKITKVIGWRKQHSNLNKYDIETVTHNFFANGILVHNSHRLAHIPDEILFPKWLKKIAYWLHLKPKKVYAHLNGSRRVCLNQRSGVSFYGSDQFRFNLTRDIILHKDETIYAEIVGYTDTGAPIMSQPIEDKVLRKEYGNQMIYKYSCPEGTSALYIYRITRINQDGKVVDLPWFQIVGRCAELGLKVVPHMIGPLIYNKVEQDKLQNLVETLSEGKSTLDSSHLKEGVVTRVETPKGETYWLKNKQFLFKVLEGIAKDAGVVDIEEATDTKGENIAQEK